MRLLLDCLWGAILIILCVIILMILVAKGCLPSI